MPSVHHNDLRQGSDAWVTFRAFHYGASEAAAMLGISPYLNRNELLTIKKTGTPKEFSDFVQSRILDKGHAIEALARPIMEKILGVSLYPVIVSDGLLSASCDGLTLDESAAWENKQWNQQTVDYMKETGMPPEHHMPQCMQVLMLTRADVLYFSVTDGTPENFEYVEVRPKDIEWFARITNGWAQFDKDLEVFEPVQYESKPLAESFETLPAIAVQIRGEVVASNMPAFKERLAAYIAGINTNLATDQDFVNADAAVKNCAATEKRIAATKEQVLGQVASIDEVIRALDDADAQLSKIRIHLEKEIKAKKDLLKAGILTKAQQALKDHVAAMEKEIAPITLVYQARDFAGVMKGLRTLATLQNAADTELAAGKITVDTLAAGIHARQAWFKVEASEYLGLFADLQQIIQKPDDDFKLIVTTRIATQKAAEAKKIAEASAAAVAAAAVSSPAVADALIAETQATLIVPVTLATQPLQIEVRETAPVGSPSLKLGQIGDRLGFTVTAYFLLSLGFAPAATEKNSKLFHEADFPRICAALQRHIAQVQANF